jgi:hypothetical protein
VDPRASSKAVVPNGTPGTAWYAWPYASSCRRGGQISRRLQYGDRSFIVPFKVCIAALREGKCGYRNHEVQNERKSYSRIDTEISPREHDRRNHFAFGEVLSAIA